VSRLIISTAMTVDGVIDVGEWYVPEGGHDRAGLEQFAQAEAMLLGRKTYEGLAGFWSPIHPAVQGAGTRPFQGAETVRLRLLESKTFDSRRHAAPLRARCGPVVAASGLDLQG